MKLRYHLACIVVLLSGSSAFSADGGGGGSGVKYELGLDLAYQPFAQTWVQGHKDAATYAYTGYSWLAYLTNLDMKREGGGKFIPPTLAVWGDVLRSTYTQDDPSGDKAKEVIKTQGFGLGLIHMATSFDMSFAAIVGVERAYLDKSGDNPRSQRYPYGFSSRFGLGWAPVHDMLGLDIRVDWVFKHFPSTQSNGDNLKAMEQQSFQPVLGISYLQ